MAAWAATWKRWLRTYAGLIFATSDGGASWRPTDIGFNNIVIPGAWDEWVSFADESRGALISDGRVFVTRDGGQTWGEIGQDHEPFISVACAADHCVLWSPLRIAELFIGR